MNHNQDKELSQLISKSRVEMPFSDFEKRLVQKLKSENTNQKTVLKNLRL